MAKGNTAAHQFAALEAALTIPGCEPFLPSANVS
jgi:hypothetical protein